MDPEEQTTTQIDQPEISGEAIETETIEAPQYQLPPNNGTGIIIPISLVQSLSEDQNPTEISPENFELLKDDLELFEQMEPLLITPFTTPENPTVMFKSLGGNRRLQALKAIGRTTVWGSVVEFREEEPGVIRAIVNGVETKNRFESVQSAEAQYTLKHNNKYSQYVMEKLDALLHSAGDIDPSRFLIQDGPTKTVEELLNSVAPGSAGAINPEFKYQLIVDASDNESATELYNTLVQDGYSAKIKMMAKRAKK